MHNCLSETLDRWISEPVEATKPMTVTGIWFSCLILFIGVTGWALNKMLHRVYGFLLRCAL